MGPNLLIDTYRIISIVNIKKAIHPSTTMKYLRLCKIKSLNKSNCKICNLYYFLEKLCYGRDDQSYSLKP